MNDDITVNNIIWTSGQTKKARDQARVSDDGTRVDSFIKSPIEPQLPRKLTKLEDKVKFVNEFADYKDQGGKRSAKSLVDKGLLTVISYGFLDKSVDKITDDELLDFCGRFK